MSLPEDDPLIFQLLSCWVYNNKIDMIFFNAKYNEVTNRLRLHVLADKLRFLEMLPVIMDYI